ncbi:MAG: hypothetical protein ACRDY7_16935, partial [Acidimicrobiia bacterium]
LYERDVAAERLRYYSPRPGPAAGTPRSARRVLRLDRSTDGGESFGKSIRVGDAASERAPVALTAGPDGAVHAVAGRSRRRSRSRAPRWRA